MKTATHVLTRWGQRNISLRAVAAKHFTALQMEQVPARMPRERQRVNPEDVSNHEC